MLRDAGPRGVHSFRFYEERMPRGAAVIHALKRDGFEIESTPETLHNGAKGTRYVLTSQSAGGQGATSSPAPVRAERTLPVAGSPAVHDQSAGGGRDGVGPLASDAPLPADRDAPLVGFDAATEIGAHVSRKPSASAYDPFRDSEAA